MALDMQDMIDDQFFLSSALGSLDEYAECSNTSLLLEKILNRHNKALQCPLRRILFLCYKPDRTHYYPTVNRAREREHEHRA